MTKSKIMGIVGNCLLVVFSVLTIGLMGLAMFKSTVGQQAFELGSVYDWFEYLGKTGTPGELTTSLVFYILTLVVACVLIVLGVLGLVATLLNKKQLNLTFVSRILTIVLMVFAFVGVVCAAVYGIHNSVKEVMTVSVSAGAILPLCFGLLACLSSFVAPTKKKQ